jgi:hypothetical protein
MNAKFDIKSVISGLCVGVLATLVLGAGFGMNSNPNQIPIGRFQITGSGALFTVIDTSTGQVWFGDFHSSLDGRVPPDYLGIPAAREAFFGPKLVLQNNGQ